jgi:hypothetical protein
MNMKLTGVSVIGLCSAVLVAVACSDGDGRGEVLDEGNTAAGGTGGASSATGGSGTGGANNSGGTGGANNNNSGGTGGANNNNSGGTGGANNNNSGGTGGADNSGGTGGADNGTGGSSSGTCDAAAVAALLGGKCNACHANAFNSASNLANNIDAAPSRNQDCEVPLVVAGDPAGSLLFQKVSGTQSADCGVQMPQGGTPLSAQEITCVSDWITSLSGGGNEEPPPEEEPPPPEEE